MTRWQPDSPGRLAAAALDLFEEHGFEATTAAQIAARAGVTERTFFRHYADKREVLFSGGAPLNAAAAASIENADPLATAFSVAGAAATAAARELPPARLPFARRRQLVIDANPGLQERELLKIASLSATIADGLETRGVDAPTAALAAEVAVSAFRVGFTRWIKDGEQRSFAEWTEQALSELGGLVAAG